MEVVDVRMLSSLPVGGCSERPLLFRIVLHFFKLIGGSISVDTERGEHSVCTEVTGSVQISSPDRIIIQQVEELTLNVDVD